MKWAEAYLIFNHGYKGDGVPDRFTLKRRFAFYLSILVLRSLASLSV